MTGFDIECWTRASVQQLCDHPLCAYCAERGIVTRAVMAVPAEGHYRGEFLISLCRECRDITERMIADHGFRCDVGLDGMPLDPCHPVYAKEK
jgi:hypothetical protein